MKTAMWSPRRSPASRKKCATRLPRASYSPKVTVSPDEAMMMAGLSGWAMACCRANTLSSSTPTWAIAETRLQWRADRELRLAARTTSNVCLSVRLPFIIAKSFGTYGRVGYLVGHLGRVAGCADAQIIPIYTLNAASTAAAPPGPFWGYGPQPQSSWGYGPQPQNGSPHTTSRTRGTRKVNLMTGAACNAFSLRLEITPRHHAEQPVGLVRTVIPIRMICASLPREADRRR